MCIDERIARAEELIAKRESIDTELAALFAGASTPKKMIKCGTCGQLPPGASA